MKINQHNVLWTWSFLIIFIFQLSLSGFDIDAYHTEKSAALELKKAEKLYSATFTKLHLRQLREETRKLFLHGWTSYMNYGFPNDEVRPLSCTGYGPNVENPQDLRNDVLGNYSVTLLDSVDTFIIMNNTDQFRRNVKLIEKYVTFDIDSTVQVFETAIRALGSLITCHLYASDETKGFKVDNYNNSLLLLAYDLGLRLLPAFDTKTGVPYARVNLRHGMKTVPTNLYYETCTAGAGSPMLEMTMLSKLTGDPVFEQVSRNAFMTLWELRSSLDLLPMTLNPQKGKWLDSITGIGASVDSFFEYALKGSILFGDTELYNVWEWSYKALSITAKSDWFFTNVNVDSGFFATYWIDSLGAFFPGLQVLSGKVSDAIKTHLMYYKLWNTFGSIPERWNFFSDQKSLFKSIALEWYPLRPEFIESTYYLYRATKDPLYLQVGARILKDFKERFTARCGFAGVQDIRTNSRQNRMESFVLSETFKYLYLLFDEENPIHKSSSNIIFSTEGHPMWLDKSIIIPYEVEEGENVTLAQESKTEASDIEERAIDELQKPLRNGIQPEQGFLDTLVDFSGKDFLHKFFKHYKSDRKALLDHSQLILQAKLNRVPMSNVESAGVVLVDDDDVCAESKQVCEVNPLQSSKQGFFSELVSWPKFYEIDSRYSNTLVQPDYLKMIDYTPFELQNNFRDRWCDDRASQCVRRPTSDGFELLFGNKDKVRLAQVEKLKVADAKLYQKFLRSKNGELGGVLKPGDYWVPLLDGIRVRMENVKAGSVDSQNKLVTAEYIQQKRRESLVQDATEDTSLEGSCKPAELPKTLRVLVLNGKSVPANSTIWVSAAVLEGSKGSKTVVQAGKNGVVLIDNDPVENMRIWDSERGSRSGPRGLLGRLLGAGK